MLSLTTSSGDGRCQFRQATPRRLSPNRLPEVPREEEAIFLPQQLVTGLGGKTSLIRRLREAGDFLALRMLVDLYAQIETDATHGVSIERLRQGSVNDVSARKVCEAGVNVVWAMPVPTSTGGNGDWIVAHRTKQSDPWVNFWERIKLLQNIGAIWFEPWVFAGAALDSEPILPLDPSVLYSYSEGDKIAQLTRLMQEVSRLFVGEREYLLDRHEADILIALPLHHQPRAHSRWQRWEWKRHSGCRMSYAHSE
jgi:hypothetical protein